MRTSRLTRRTWPGPGSVARRIYVVLGAALCAIAGIAVWVLATGHLDATAGRALASTFATAVCAATGLVGATVLERADHRRSLGLLTILLSAIVLALTLVFIWTLPEDVALPHAIGACSALLGAAVHACLMLGRVRAGDTRAVRGLSAASVLFATACAVLIAGALAFVADSPLAGSWRVLGVLAVLCILTTLLAPIARRLSRRAADRPRPGVGSSDAQPADAPSADARSADARSADAPFAGPRPGRRRMLRARIGARPAATQ